MLPDLQYERQHYVREDGRTAPMVKYGRSKMKMKSDNNTFWESIPNRYGMYQLGDAVGSQITRRASTLMNTWQVEINDGIWYRYGKQAEQELDKTWCKNRKQCRLQIGNKNSRPTTVDIHTMTHTSPSGTSRRIRRSPQTTLSLNSSNFDFSFNKSSQPVDTTLLRRSPDPSILTSHCRIPDINSAHTQTAKLLTNMAARLEGDAEDLTCRITRARVLNWELTRSSAYTRNQVSQSEKSERKNISYDEREDRHTIYMNLLSGLETLDKDAKRGTRIINRRNRRACRLAHKKQLHFLLSTQHTAERKAADMWDIPGRYAVYLDEIQSLEELLRRNIILRLNCNKKLIQYAIVEGRKAIIRQIDQRAESLRIREAVWLDAQLAERQGRIEVSESEINFRKEFISLMEYENSLIEKSHQEHLKRLEEQKKKEVEIMIHARFRFQREEHTKRVEIEYREITTRNELSEQLHQSNNEAIQLVNIRMEAERDAIAAQYLIKLGECEDDEITQRDAQQLKERKEWGDLMRNATSSWEYAQRPLLLNLNDTSFPEWILGDSLLTSLPLCPSASVTRRKQTELGKSPLTSAFLHVTPICVGDDSSVHISAVESDFFRLQSNCSSLQIAADTYYKPNSSPPIPMAANGNPESSGEEFRFETNSSSIRIDFLRISGDIKAEDIETMIRSLSFASSESAQGCDHISVRIYLQVTCGVGTVFDFDVSTKVILSPPLICTHPSCRVGCYSLEKPRQHMSLLPLLTMPGVTLPDPKQRKYSGGYISVRYIEGVMSEDNFYIAGVNKMGCGVFEGQDYTLRNETDDGICGSPKPKRKFERRRTLTASVQLSKLDELGFRIGLSESGDWNEGRIKRLLQSITYINHSVKPHRPKRIVEISASESPHRDPSRPPSTSIISVEINIMFPEDPTFWLVGSLAESGNSCPVKIYRGSSRNCPPRHLSFITPCPILLCPDILIQNQDSLQQFRGGHLSVIASQNGCIGDAILVQELHEVGLYISTEGRRKVIWKGNAVASITSFEGTQLQPPSFRIDFNTVEPFAELDCVQILLRRLSFMNTTKPRLGQRVFSLEVSVSNPGSLHAEALRTTLGLRVLPPCAEITTPSAFYCSYIEGQGWKRLSAFESSTSFDRCDDDLINLFDTGSILCEVISISSEDEFKLIEPTSEDYYLTEMTDATTGKNKVIIKQKGPVLNEEPYIIGEYDVTEPGDPLLIKFTPFNEIIAATYEDQSEEMTLSKPARVKTKLLKSILNSICYRNESDNPSALQKIIRITVEDWLGAKSQCVIDLTITPVNNPTDIILAHPKISFRQGTTSTRDGILLLPGSDLVDVDTDKVFPDAFLSIELVSGDTGQDILFLPEVNIEPDRSSGSFSGSESINNNALPSTSTLDSELMSEFLKTGPVVVCNKNLYIGNEIVGVVQYKDRAVGRGPTLHVTFTTSFPLCKCAEVLRSIFYNNTSHPIKPGQRTYTIKFNAGDGVSDSRARCEVEVLPPIIWAPTFTKTAQYTEGAPPCCINQKVISGLPLGLPLAGASMRADITQGFVEREDVIDFSNPQLFKIEKGTIYGTALGSRGSVFGKLITEHDNSGIELQFPPDSQVTAKHLNALYRAFKYHNTSSNPSTELRKVQFLLDIEGLQATKKHSLKQGTYPIHGFGTGIVEVGIEVVPVDDQTEVIPKKLAVCHVLNQGDTLLFEDCEVDDADTPIFLAPYSYVEVFLRTVNGSERMTLSEHRLSVNRNSGIHISGNQVIHDSVTIGKLSLTQESRGIKFRVDLLDCPLDVLRKLIQGLTYKCSKSNVTAQKHLRYSVTITVRGGNRVAPTKVVVHVTVIQKTLEIAPGFKSSGSEYLLASVYPNKAFNITGGVSFMWSGKTAGFEIRCRFNSTERIQGEGYQPRLTESTLSLRNRRHTTPAISATDLLSNARRGLEYIMSDVDIPKTSIDHLSLRLAAPFKIRENQLWYGREKVATVSNFNDGPDKYGIVVSMGRHEKTTSQALNTILRGFWYECHMKTPETRKVAIQFSISTNVESEISKSNTCKMNDIIVVKVSKPQDLDSDNNINSRCQHPVFFTTAQPTKTTPNVQRLTKSLGNIELKLK